MNLERKTDRIHGVLLGTAVGDALGLPAEGLRPDVIRRLGWAGRCRHRFLFGRGMWSDDTEHTIMLAQAFLRADGDVKCFAKSFGWELQWWLLGLPAGVGLATLRSILKLWLGFPVTKSGVFSAGNGPCMRAAVIGVCLADDSEKRRAFTAAHTEPTHRDPKAMTAALAVADLAALFAKSEKAPSCDEVFAVLRQRDADGDWQGILGKLEEAVREGASFAAFFERIGGDPRKGISGYAYLTVPAAIHAGLSNSWDLEGTVADLIAAGGDTDSTAAIGGALCGDVPQIVNFGGSWLR